MTFEEIENCTFEPNCGTQNPLNKEGYDIDPGRENEPSFFDKMGDNFIKSNPKIYKKGILKKSALKLKEGSWDDSFNTLFLAFNVEKLIWQN
jgi:hypothetical protein